MKGTRGEILYIGKAKDLSKRVASYFHNRPKSTKLTILVDKIRDIDIIKTASEEEALIYEANLIKKHKPKYNILMKDDKNHVYIKITDEIIPKIIKTRIKHSRIFPPSEIREINRREKKNYSDKYGLFSRNIRPKIMEILNYDYGWLRELIESKRKKKE